MAIPKVEENNSETESYPQETRIEVITVNCDFGGQSSPVKIYIGNPKEDNHPIHFQSEWLTKARGGSIPAEVMESLQNLFNLSKENDVDFCELVRYAFNEAIEKKKKKKAKNKSEKEQLMSHRK